MFSHFASLRNTLSPLDLVFVRCEDCSLEFSFGMRVANRQESIELFVLTNHEHHNIYSALSKGQHGVSIMITAYMSFTVRKQINMHVLQRMVS